MRGGEEGGAQTRIRKVGDPKPGFRWKRREKKLGERLEIHR